MQLAMISSLKITVVSCKTTKAKHMQLSYINRGARGVSAPLVLEEFLVFMPTDF